MIRLLVAALLALFVGIGGARAQAPPSTQCVSTALAGGTADAITIPQLPCVPTTTLLMLTTPQANTTATPTITVTGSPPQVVKRFDNTALHAGDFPIGGHTILTNNGQNWFLLTLPQGANTAANINSFGAIADDSTNVGPALQAAYNANVGCVYIPRGIYRLSSAVTMSAQAPCFFGDPPNEAVQVPQKTGTWIHIVSTSFNPITISAITGQGAIGGFSNIGFFQDQPAPGAGWAPAAYPYIFTLNVNLGRVDFTNINFYNVTHCINFIGSARSRVKVMGQPVGTCLQYDQMHDVAYLDEVNFWPFWSSDTNVMTYQQANVDPVVFLRADAPFIGHYFTYGYHSGVKFGSSSDGVTIGAQIDDLQLDACKYCLWITGNNSQLQISNLRTGGEAVPTGNLAGSEGVRDDSNNSVLSIANLECFYAGSNCVDLDGSTPGNISISSAILVNFNNDNNSSVGLRANSGGTIQLAKRPVVINPQHGGQILPAVTTNAYYFIPGVPQSMTPTLVGTTTAGTPAYAAQFGNFWDDGSRISLNFNVQLSGAFIGASGSVAIQGIPRPPYGTSGHNSFCYVGSHAGVVLDTGYTVLTGIVPGGPGATQILLLESAAGLATQALPVSTIGSGAIIQGTCTYAWE